MNFPSETKHTISRYLNVAERNDAAKKIASILSRGNPFKREGLSEYNKIYEFGAEVFGHQAEMVMTSVSGQLMGYKFPPDFKDWETYDPKVLFDAPIFKECLQDQQNVKKTLEREIDSCQGLIIWTDCDREGENIGFDIYKVCSNVKSNLVVCRAKFFDITEASVFRALENLCEINVNVSQAVDVRQELDLRIGAAFTRMQTLRLRKVFPQTLANSTISYGSCQFPTLGFVVDRSTAIEEFVSQPFWRVRLHHKIKDQTAVFFWKRDKLFDENACETILRNCQENPMTTVELVEKKMLIKSRPLPLTTVELIKVASQKFIMSLKDIIKIAQRLYTQGYISYPRTKTEVFFAGSDFLTTLVEQHCENNKWGTFAQRILNEGGPDPRNGRKSKEVHPPIYPTKSINNWSDLNENEQKIYEYIVRHFLACLGKDAIGQEILVHVEIANEKFVAKGLQIEEMNYLDVFPYEEWNTKQIYAYQNGETFLPSELSLEKSSTSSPELLTEGELVTLMEENGIGTDATYANHIERIKELKYVNLDENMRLVPSPLGLGLVEGYNIIGLELSLAKPNLRADLECNLKLICEGFKSAELVKREQIEKYKALYTTVMRKIGEIERALSIRLQEQPQKIIEVKPEEFKPILKCPKCDVNYITVRTLFSCTGNPTCKNITLLPFCTENVEVLDESCGTCGPDIKKLKVKFRQNPFPEEPNPKILCIGGCDGRILETLNINCASVRKDVECETIEMKEEKVEDISSSNNPTIPKTIDESAGPSATGPECKCKFLAELATSNTMKNPGRKYYRCLKCKFFKWLDEWLQEINENTSRNDCKEGAGDNTAKGSGRSSRNQNRNTASTSGVTGNGDGGKNFGRTGRGDGKTRGNRSVPY